MLAASWLLAGIAAAGLPGAEPRPHRGNGAATAKSFAGREFADRSSEVLRKGAARAAVSLSLWVKHSNDSWRSVAPDSALREGEQFALVFRVRQPAFVWLFESDPNGETTQIFPSPGASVLVDPSVTHRLPGEAQGSFGLHGPAGLERVVIVSSRKPLRADRVLPRLVRAALDARPSAAARTGRSSSAAGVTGVVRRDPHPDPEHALEFTRTWTEGDSLGEAGPGQSLDLEADRDGVAVGVFSFQHLP